MSEVGTLVAQDIVYELGRVNLQFKKIIDEVIVFIIFLLTFQQVFNVVIHQFFSICYLLVFVQCSRR